MSMDEDDSTVSFEEFFNLMQHKVHRYNFVTLPSLNVFFHLLCNTDVTRGMMGSIITLCHATWGDGLFHHTCQHGPVNFESEFTVFDMSNGLLMAYECPMSNSCLMAPTCVMAVH